MSFRLRRRKWRALLALPFLLLVPLGAVKWRADVRKEWQAEHPPLSKMDQALRAADKTAIFLSVQGNTAQGKSLIPFSPQHSLQMSDKEAGRELLRTLRCSDQVAPSPTLRNGELWLELSFDYEDSPGYECFYARDAQGASLCAPGRTSNGALLFGTWYKVPPRFAARFEALVARWVQRARSGKDVGYQFKPPLPKAS